MGQKRFQPNISPTTNPFLSLPQVKSFIETQKALLAEIQNGCKRNFILAKEQEEKEQKLQQSASMPEITVTEALEEEGPGEDEEDEEEEGEEAGEGPVSSENGAAEPAEDGAGASDSDSDTDEDEEDAGLATKDLSRARGQNDSSGTATTATTTVVSPQQAGTPPASPQGNERRISVSSPGRGHKIFVVTRVESLPERREATDGPAAKPPEPPPAPTPASGSPKRANGGAPSPEELGSPLPCEGQALPNGLKTDFARALPDASPEGDGKAGSCAAEHGKTPLNAPRGGSRALFPAPGSFRSPAVSRRGVFFHGNWEPAAPLPFGARQGFEIPLKSV